MAVEGPTAVCDSALRRPSTGLLLLPYYYLVPMGKYRAVPHIHRAIVPRQDNICPSDVRPKYPLGITPCMHQSPKVCHYCSCSRHRDHEVLYGKCRTRVKKNVNLRKVLPDRVCNQCSWRRVVAIMSKSAQSQFYHERVEESRSYAWCPRRSRGRGYCHCRQTQ